MAIISLDEAREEQNKKVKRKAQRIYEGLSEEEFGKLLTITKKDHHRLAFLLAYGSGLRISEVVGLKKDDVEYKSNKIFIRQGKGSKDRVVNTPKQLKEKYLNLLPFTITQRAIEAVFLRKSLAAGINKIIGYYTAKDKQIPIYRYHFHSLRHSYALRALDKGVPVNVLQAMLGHNSLATTDKYTKVTQQDAIEKILEKGV